MVRPVGKLVSFGGDEEEFTMKVGIIADPLDVQSAGIHTYTRHLVEGLRRFGTNLELMVVRPGRGEVPAAGEYHVPVWPGVPGHQRVRQWTSIPALLNRLRPDVVIEPAHFGPFCLSRGIRRVTVIHDLTPVLRPEWHGIGSVLVHRVLLPRVLRRADAVVAVSRQTAADIRQQFPKTGPEPEVIHPAIDDRFRPVPEAGVCQKYGIRGPFLLHVGTLEPRKNLPFLLTAWEDARREVGKDGQRLQLVLAGQWGWKAESLRQRIAESAFADDIILPGYVPDEDLPHLYSAALAMVFPSHYEGFGYPVAEALACGCQVLTSGQAALSEFNHDRISLFALDDPTELKQIIIQALQSEADPTNSEIIRNTDAFREAYSLRKMIAKWEEVLQRLTS